MKKLVINQHDYNNPIIEASEGTVTGIRQSAGVYILTTSFSVEGKHIFTSMCDALTDLSGGLLYGSVTGANEITLINWTDSGLPNDEVNSIGILIV